MASVHVPAANAAKLVKRSASTGGDGRAESAAETAANVVANSAVGFGPPETVTVGWPASGFDVPFEEDADEEGRMANCDEEPYSTP
jgi:hypothetical protein